MNNGRDWATDALNSTVGQVTMAILEDSRLNEGDGEVKFPANWLSQLERLLTLDDDLPQYACGLHAQCQHEPYLTDSFEYGHEQCIDESE